MQAQISMMESVISDSVELVDLKQQAQAHLSKMQASLTATEKAEQTEQQQLITLMQKMQERMALLETQATTYKQKLFQQRASSLTDVLTKLPNRMAYEEKIAIEVAQFKATNTPLTLAILDIDLFKKINDKYGHSVGDKTLQVIASNIRKTFDPNVFVGRWGGEEFICVFPGITLNEAFALIEKVRIKVSSLPFMFKGQRVTVTISSGAAEFSGKSNAQTVFDLADQHLYSAKENGRNQTVIVKP